MYEYKIRNWDKSPNGYQYIAKTENVIGTLDSITLTNTSNKKDFRIRGGKITTKLKNILINGNPILDWIFMDPNIDKTTTIILTAGPSAYIMKLYKEYEDVTVNIFIKHMANDKIIIASNGLFKCEIENNLDLIEFKNRFQK